MLCLYTYPLILYMVTSFVGDLGIHVKEKLCFDEPLNEQNVTQGRREKCFI